MKPHEACILKRGYDTEAEALCKGFRVYFCLFCARFHRSTLEQARNEPAWVGRRRFLKRKLKLKRQALVP